MTHTIELFIENNAWMAKFSEPEVKELFGTDIVETAFTSTASPLKVLEEIKALNPDCAILIR